MRLISIVMSLAFAVTAGQAAHGQTPGTGNAAAERPGWYLGVGAGPGWGATLDQAGWNQESFCYPDAACFNEVPIPSVPGYRWSYDIDLDAGAGAEVFVGRSLPSGARFELALGWGRNSATQQFTGITYFDGAEVLHRPGSPVVSNTQAYVDNFNARSAMLNAYYDFPNALGRVTPYVGVGLGLAALELAGLHFSNDYEDTQGDIYDPPLDFYNSVQNADLRGTRLQWAVHAGADFPATAQLQLGIRLSYTGAGDFEATAGYDKHPFNTLDPDFTNTTRLSGARALRLTLTLKRAASW